MSGYSRDRNILWKRKEIYIPVERFSGLQLQAIVSGGQTYTALLQISPDSALAQLGKTTTTSYTIPGRTFGINLASLGTGARIVREIEALAMTGMLMTTDGDDVQHVMMLPSDLDRNHTMGVRVHWTSAAAAVGSRALLWRVRFLPVTAGTTALILPATALDTAIAAQAPAGTSSVIERTGRGIINASTLAAARTHIAWRVEAQTITSFTENKYLLGLEIDYVPRMTQTRYDQERLVDAPPVQNNFLDNVS